MDGNAIIIGLGSAFGTTTFVGLIFRNVFSRISKVEIEQKESPKVFVTKENHDLLCENSSLKITDHVTKEITNLEASMSLKIESIKSCIENGNNKSPSSG